VNPYVVVAVVWWIGFLIVLAAWCENRDERRDHLLRLEQDRARVRAALAASHLPVASRAPGVVKAGLPVSATEPRPAATGDEQQTYGSHTRRALSQRRGRLLLVPRDTAHVSGDVRGT
jgi:hypothetical protein